MSGQDQHRGSRHEEEPEEAAAPAAATAPAVQGDDVDALLDEIDDVLESNAEEFVKGFVQKGGQ